MALLRRALRPMLVAASLTLALAGATYAGSPITAKSTGGGIYQLLGRLPATFQYDAIQFADGDATGEFSHSVIFQGQLVAFTGRVTCLTMDPVNHRAWVGGVITSNTSLHPSFLQPRNEVGHDIWFRVVDYGEGGEAPADRTTFVGFEGDAGFATSAAYCAGQPWPANDDRTWTVSEGNLQVHD